MPRRWRLLAILGPLTIFADQITKYWARHSLPTDERGNPLPVTVIEGYWDWVLAYNRGSAFSLFEDLGGGRFWLSLVGVIATGAIIWMVHKAKDEQTGFIVALTLMAGGAIGNLIDRIAFGKVTDFVLWHYHEHHWPVFNVADVCLCIAVGLFLLVSYRDRKKEELEAEETKGTKKKNKAAKAK